MNFYDFWRERAASMFDREFVGREWVAYLLVVPRMKDTGGEWEPENERAI